MNNILHDAIEVIHFTEEVSTKLHDGLHEDEIYRTIRESPHAQCSLSVLLLDGKTLTLAATNVQDEIAKKAEKAGSFPQGVTIDVEKSPIFRQVTQGETVTVSAKDIADCLVSEPAASAILEISGYQNLYAVLTPLKQEMVQGVVAAVVASAEVAEYVAPSVQHLAHHISTALAMSHTYVAHSQTADMSEEQAEKLLKEFKIHTTLFERLPVAVGISTSDGRILASNTCMSEMTGYSQAELKYININDMVEYPDNHLCQDYPQEKGIVCDCMVKLKHKDGTSYSVSLTGARGTLEGREIYLTIFQDATQRERVEMNLRESGEKFKIVFENQSAGILLGRVDALSAGKISLMEFNSATLEFFGYTREEFRTKTIADLSHPDDFEKDIALLREVLAKTRDSYEIEKRFIRKDGQIVWGLLTVTSLRDAHGDVTFLIASVQDITDQKRSEEALRKSEQEFRLAFENAKDAIFWADSETGIIIRCNKAAEILLQKSREAIIGHHQTEVHPPEKSDYYAAMFRRHIEEGIAEDIEAEVLSASGAHIPVHISASLMTIGERPIIQGIFRDITGIKQAEKALRDSEKRYRAVIEDQTELICRFLPDATLTFVNEAYCRYFGKDKKALLGKKFMPLIPAEDREKDRDSFTSLTRENPVGTVEHRVIVPGGETRWQQWTNRAIFDSQGTLVEYQGVGRDITERKQAEQKLRYQADLLENVSDAIISTDLAFTIITWNKAAETIYGWKADEVIGKPVQEVLKTDYGTSRKENTEREFFSKEHWEGEVIQERKDGTPVHILASVSLIKDDTGTPVGAVAVNRDITEKKQAELALQRSEMMYRQLVESLHEGIWVIDDTACTTFVNDRMAEMLGYTVEEMMGKHLFSFMDEKGVAACKRNLERRKQGITEQHDFEFRKKDGTRIYTTLETSPIMADGKYAGAIAGVINITERKQAEEALQWELDVNTALSELYSPLISPTSSLEEITITVLDQAKRLTHSEHGYVASIDPGTRALVAHTLTEMLKDQCEVSPEKRGIIFLPEEDGRYSGLWGYSLNTLEPFYTNTPGTHPAFKGVPEGHIPVQTFLSVPVLLGREVVGQIALANKDGGYTHQDLEAICRFADVYALAIQRVQIEERLQESEEKFRGIAERNFDAIFELDKYGNITYISPAVERIIGYPHEEVVGNSFLTYAKESDVPRIIQVREDLMKGKLLEGFQAEIVRKDGSSAFIELNISPIIKEGTVAGVQGVARDITERRRAEKELRESEEKYRTLVEQSLQGILTVQGSSPRLVFVNSAMAEISGYTVEELLSLSPEDIGSIVHPEDQQIFERYMIRLEGRPAVPRYEFRIIRKDGSVRWLELHASRIEYQGEPAVQAAVVDITERRHVEDQIKASLREKEVLLREIHHRVKNNLQVISSLLSLQASHSKDSQYAEMLQDSQHRIRTMALIHERLYQSENLADIDFKEYITRLVYGLVRSYNVTDTITVTIDVEDVSLGIDAAIPCGLIINELVSNSLKYAFPDKTGEITVSLHAVDSTAQLVVADNGIGMPDTLDFRATETLGLDLVVALAEEQLEGSISLDRTEGTVFTITFEVDYSGLQ